MRFYQSLHHPGFHGDYYDVGRSQRAVIVRNGLQFRIESLYFGGFARAAVDDRNVLWSEQGSQVDNPRAIAPPILPPPTIDIFMGRMVFYL